MKSMFDILIKLEEILISHTNIFFKGFLKIRKLESKYSNIELKFYKAESIRINKKDKFCIKIIYIVNQLVSFLFNC